MSSTDPSPNRYFTWEAHTTMLYAAGTQLSFGSVDDLWVFVNGRLAVDLGGVHARRDFLLNLDAVATQLGLAPGGVYPVDIFYAHRSARHPELKIQLADDPPCSPASTARLATAFTYRGAAQNRLGAVRVQSPTDVVTSSGAYLTQPISLEDFQLDFSVSMTAGNAPLEGFAVVLAASPTVGAPVERWETLSPTVLQRTVDAGTLGYSGIAISLAIEFDSFPQATANDPLVQHVSVMTRGALANSSTHSLAQRGPVLSNTERHCWWPWASCAATKPFSLSANNRVRVRWTRSQDSMGWLRVWLDPDVTVTPDLEVELSTAELLTMFPTGLAYLGVTSGFGMQSRHATDGGLTSVNSTGAGTIELLNISAASTVPGPQGVVAVAPPATVVLGQPVTTRVRSASACGPMVFGGFASSLLASATSGAASRVPTVVDRGDGTYDVTYTPSLPGSWSLTLNTGGVLTGSPFMTMVTPLCGDGVPHAPEQCDDGNMINTDACTNACTTARCGDSFTQPGEQCDDGNAVNTDACTNACTSARCGDSFVQMGEQCDDGNAANGDTCSNACTTPRCGDAITQSGEQCDDGNAVNDDACSNACTAPRCGDTIVQTGEQCDDGNAVNTDACSNACTTPRCGDTIVQLGEQCDDGNAVNTDACSNACTTPRCGDAITQSGEQCDDGNAVNDDACSNACASARCGDTIVQAGELCDDGNAVNDDACTNTCTSASCGDTIVQTGEQCDDGNAVNDDACTSACTSPACGDRIVQSGEDCDDGNIVGGDGCSATCTSEVVDAGTDAGSGGGNGADDAGMTAAGGGSGMTDDGGMTAAGGGSAMTDDAGMIAAGGGGEMPAASGCGCQSSGPELAWLLMGLLAVRRRSASRG